MTKTKPAIKSLGVWASASGLITLFYKLVGVISDLPADLVSDTQAFAVGTVAAVIALYGRWRAALKIDGLFSSKK